MTAQVGAGPVDHLDAQLQPGVYSQILKIQLRENPAESNQKVFLACYQATKIQEFHFDLLHSVGFLLRKSQKRIEED